MASNRRAEAFVYWACRIECSVVLALQLPFLKISESMGNHDSKNLDADSVD
jgi:hypothetical protein